MAEPPSRAGSAERMLAEVFAVRTQGGYVQLTLVADPAARRARPGSFVTLGVGGETSARLRPRAFWVHGARSAGVSGGTLDVVFAVGGPGTRWLAERRRHDTIPLVGPLGRAFSLPREPVVCALVGDGTGAAPLSMLSDRLRERGCSVHIVLGARGERELLGALEARRGAQSVTVTTRDGSVGVKGEVARVLPGVLERHEVDVVYAGGPLATLRAVAEIAADAGCWCQVAVEAPMSCGTGLCLSCALPLRDHDGVVRAARACVDGPVVAAERLDWTALR